MRRLSKHSAKKRDKRNLICDLTEYQGETKDFQSKQPPKFKGNRDRKMGRTLGEMF